MKPLSKRLLALVTLGFVLSLGGVAMDASAVVVCTKSTITDWNTQKKEIRATIRSDGEFTTNSDAYWVLNTSCVTNVPGEQLYTIAFPTNIVNIEGARLQLTNYTNGNGSFEDLREGGFKPSHTVLYQQVQSMAQLNPFVAGAQQAIVYRATAERAPSEFAKAFPLQRSTLLVLGASPWAGNVQPSGIYTKTSATSQAVYESEVLYADVEIKVEMFCPTNRIQFEQDRSQIDYGRISPQAFNKGPIVQNFTLKATRPLTNVNAACPRLEDVGVRMTSPDIRTNSIYLKNKGRNAGLKVDVYQPGSDNRLGLGPNTLHRIGTVSNSSVTVSKTFETRLSPSTTTDKILEGDFSSVLRIEWVYP